MAPHVYVALKEPSDAAPREVGGRVTVFSERGRLRAVGEFSGAARRDDGWTCPPAPRSFLCSVLRCVLCVYQCKLHLSNGPGAGGSPRPCPQGTQAGEAAATHRPCWLLPADLQESELGEGAALSPVYPNRACPSALRVPHDSSSPGS